MHKMRAIDIQAASANGILEEAGTLRRVAADGIIYTQGAPAQSVFFIQKGIVMLTVRARNRRRAVIAILSAGSFFSEPCLNDHRKHLSTATAITATSIIVIKKNVMARMLVKEASVSSFFWTSLLTSMIQLRDDFHDMLVSTSEQRLARALLHMAQMHPPHQVAHIPIVNQQILAEMVGTTRSRVNFFMNRFRKRGLISYNGYLHVKNALKTVALR
ncbi:MAG TPA: Crp/Fnr family transcriptional regulator [Candidatus Limnocylindrales bacterium]|nr:Crp/Fnr family transcriptional regulator [Candidatus Limnocylindrales bacterium]